MSPAVLQPSRIRQHPALTYLGLADRLCQTLAEHDTDCAPLEWLAERLGVPETELRTAVDYALHLGICDEVLYCLPRQPVAAGFEPCHRGGRMQLRLRGSGLRPPLLIRGARVGPVPKPQRGQTLGAGELAYTISRLTLMATNWLPPTPDPTRYLFELIAEAWRHGTGARQLRGMGIHRAYFGTPIAVGPGAPGGATNRLELVTYRRLSGHELVNVYPIPARGGQR